MLKEGRRLVCDFRLTNRQAAIANEVYAAGVEVKQAPVTPEVILKAPERRQGAPIIVYETFTLEVLTFMPCLRRGCYSIVSKINWFSTEDIRSVVAGATDLILFRECARNPTPLTATTAGVTIPPKQAKEGGNHVSYASL